MTRKPSLTTVCPDCGAKHLDRMHNGEKPAPGAVKTHYCYKCGKWVKPRWE